jgi:hypothetical protein
MAAVTTEQLLSELQQACYRSAWVDRVETRVIDADTLSVRIHLTRAETFISVFSTLPLTRPLSRWSKAVNASIAWITPKWGGTRTPFAIRLGMSRVHQYNSRISSRARKRITRLNRDLSLPSI